MAKSGKVQDGVSRQADAIVDALRTKKKRATRADRTALLREQFQKTFTSNLNLALDQLGIKHSVFADAMPTPRSNVSHWTNGHQLPKGVLLYQIPATFYKLKQRWLSLHWLMTSKGPRWAEDPSGEDAGQSYKRGMSEAAGRMARIVNDLFLESQPTSADGGSQDGPALLAEVEARHPPERRRKRG